MKGMVVCGNLRDLLYLTSAFAVSSYSLFSHRFKAKKRGFFFPFWTKVKASILITNFFKLNQHQLVYCIISVFLTYSESTCNLSITLSIIKGINPRSYVKFRILYLTQSSLYFHSKIILAKLQHQELGAQERQQNSGLISILLAKVALILSKTSGPKYDFSKLSFPH